MKLAIGVTDLDGNTLTWFDQFRDAEVDIPLNDARTAKCQLSIYDGAASFLRDQGVIGGGPLDRMLKVVYRGRLVFWGQVVKPIWRAQAEALELNAHDSSLRLKHHYHQAGDAAVAAGYTIDGDGLRTLVDSANPSGAELAAGVKGLGIVWGSNTVPAWAYVRKAERGQNVWESIQNISTSVEAGLDYELEPIDPTHDPLGLYVPGVYCQLNTWDRQGRDRTSDSTEEPPERRVIFHCGFGRDNAQDFVWEPDGEAVRNRAIYVWPGGEKATSGQRGAALVQSSLERYGIYETYESVGSSDEGIDETNRQAVVDQKAVDTVASYAFPPDFFTITPKWEGPGGGGASEYPYRYGDHFWVGDRISAAVRKGEMKFAGDARVIGVTLKQQDAQKNMQTDIRCVPHVADPGDADVV